MVPSLFRQGRKLVYEATVKYIEGNQLVTIGYIINQEAKSVSLIQFQKMKKITKFRWPYS